MYSYFIDIQHNPLLGNIEAWQQRLDFLNKGLDGTRQKYTSKYKQLITITSKLLKTRF